MKCRWVARGTSRPQTIRCTAHTIGLPPLFHKSPGLLCEGWNDRLMKPGKVSQATTHACFLRRKANIFCQLTENYQCDDEIRDIVLKAKENAEYHALPCKEEHGNPSHRYQVRYRTPFRVRCSMPECGS